jgi:hypothetical protein
MRAQRPSQLNLLAPRRELFVLVALTLSLTIFSGCKFPTGAVLPNTPPDTRLANSPTDDTTAQYIRLGGIPEKTLFWVGDDPDGFIIAYRYRWITTYRGGSGTTAWNTVLNLTSLRGILLDPLILVHGEPTSYYRIYNFLATFGPDDETIRESIVDSLKTGRPFAVPYHAGIVPGDSLRGANPLNLEAPTKGTFIFSSHADSNMHRFEVVSVDNNDAVDPTPAVVHFWTLRSPSPTAVITGIPAGLRYIIRYPTRRSPGLTFTFAGIDPSTNERDYSWSVDDTLHWSEWNRQASAVVDASYLQHDTSDTHRIFLRVRNRWGVVSPIVSSTFLARVPPIDDPSYPRRTLIINNCKITGPGSVDSNAVKQFYASIMDSLGMGGRYTIWTTGTPHPPLSNYAFPSRDTMMTYTSILIVFDQATAAIGADAQRRLDISKQDTLSEYLNVGGKLIWSGTPSISVAIADYGSWANLYFHAVPWLQNSQLDFTGVTGLLGYPNVRLDTLKADSGYALSNIATAFPRGFGQAIFLFRSKTPGSQFQNAPVGVRYLAPEPTPPARQTYSVVFLGFPLYYAVRSDAVEVLRKALSDINE